ncbi:hypothetical protein MFIFM68171_04756 [Madurella fahalii]|uniref:Heterokaryon incompatibility domain-containing protein n=1 Tax=Madurella fahalii TaxID=1157608 RepID=A0ABQ0G9Z4_9PEZI
MGLCKNRLWNLVNVSDRKQSDLPDIMAALTPHKNNLGHPEHKFCTLSKCQWAQMNSTSVKQLHKCGKCESEKHGMNDSRSAKNTEDSKLEPDGLSERAAGAGSRKKESRAGIDKETSCCQKQFPVELLETALELGKGTAWLCTGKSPKLGGPKDRYIAISHVWSDDTGVGVKDPGTVNACLFKFFAGIAHELGCKAVWWDALSIPYEPKARNKALNMMHANYANAEYTVVHDNYLLNFPLSDDGGPCLALVLSSWFTRGWTALELAMSKRVKVLFGNPVKGGPPVIKDLKSEVLAKSPSLASRAHWLATTLVQRLRKPVDNIGDLLAILSPRSTSWARDRTIIAALLAGVPDCDFTAGESIITSKVLEYVGKIPYTCLLHGKPTMRDREEYSWCAATLDDMPVDISTDIGGGTVSKTRALLEIDESGAVEGKWWCRAFRDEDDANKTQVYGNDLAAAVKVHVALCHWKRRLLLRYSDDKCDSALLVLPTSIIRAGPILKCRYIGAVVENPENPEEGEFWLTPDILCDPYPGDWCLWDVRLGGTDDGKHEMLAEKVPELMVEFGEGQNFVGDDNESVKGDDGDLEPEPSTQDDHESQQPPE